LGKIPWCFFCYTLVVDIGKEQENFSQKEAWLSYKYLSGFYKEVTTSLSMSINIRQPESSEEPM
jgi:hypothetical protein